MSALKLFLLGPPRVALNDAPVDLKRRKALALLCYLAVSGQPHSRDALATLFYPDNDQSRARAYLRRDLAIVNTGLAGDWLEADRDIVELKQSDDLWVDVDQFRRRLAACRSHDHSPETPCADCVQLLGEAVKFYTGDFLAGFTLRDCPEFDDWQFFQMEGLRQQLAIALERLVEGLSLQGASEAATPHARRWVALDPLYEPAQQFLIQLYDRAGQPAAALRQYEEFVTLLDNELGIPPEEETITLYEAIKAKRMLDPFVKAKQSRPKPQLQLKQSLGSEPEPTPVNLKRDKLQHNLPPQPTSFVGRETELARIQQLLMDEADCRMLTLVGPGGTGKTRLALEAGRQLLKTFPQGVFFVALASVGQTRLVISAIAKALSFTFTSVSDPKSQLLSYLQEKKMLLVIDNFEHLLGEADLLPDILNTAPQVKLLVTSRERLNLQEEWSYEVRGMAFPHPTAGRSAGDLAELERYSAIQLFIQRARRAKASFSISEQDNPALLRICQLVDGMPLGLELAAPWVRLMSVGEIAAEIERNLDFLISSIHNVPERHRSVRAVFEQTWERLLPDEQSVLSKLSVFQGGCRREAAETVAGATLPLLLSLVDKALVRRTATGRYEMHELIRQFAEEQVRVNPKERELAQNRHYHYYTCFLQQRTESLKGGRQKETLAEISDDIDNVRAAWQRAVKLKDAAAIERAAECLCLYSEMRGALDEGEAAFRQAAAAFTTFTAAEIADAALAEDHLILRGFLLVGQGMLRAHRGDLQEGRALLAEGLPSLRQGDEQGRHLPKKAFALLWLGWTLFLQGKTGEAEQIVRESLDLFSEIGDRWGVAKNLFVLGNSLTARGQLAESEPPLRESLKICQDIDDRRSALLVNRNLAILTLWFGDYDQTAKLLDQAATLSQEFDDQIGLAYALRERGKLELARGEYHQAIETLQQSMAITDDIGSRWESAATLDDLGVALRLTGDYAGAEWALNQCLEAAQGINNRYYTARCLADLGVVAYHKGAYDQAEERLGQALALWLSFGHEPYRAYVLSQWGYVRAAGGDDRQAGHYFAQSLQLSTRHKVAPYALEAMIGAAALLARRGNKQYPAQLLALVARHEASAFETKEKARHLLQELALAGSDGASATASDPARDWQVMAGQIIELLASSD